jgi:hypothetical protein
LGNCLQLIALVLHRSLEEAVLVPHRLHGVLQALGMVLVEQAILLRRVHQVRDEAEKRLSRHLGALRVDFRWQRAQLLQDVSAHCLRAGHPATWVRSVVQHRQRPGRRLH